jgi:heme A synthase
MLGIQDPIVALAYLLCLISTLLCVVYGWRNWNRGDETVAPDDVKWAKEEDKAEEEV